MLVCSPSHFVIEHQTVRVNYIINTYGGWVSQARNIIAVGCSVKATI